MEAASSSETTLTIMYSVTSQTTTVGTFTGSNTLNLTHGALEREGDSEATTPLYRGFRLEEKKIHGILVTKL
jgi:hypothetical protein